MKNTLPITRICLLLIIIMAGPTISMSQEKGDTAKHESYFKISGSYLSNSVYNGRKDSLPTPYILPSVGYFDKSGFYLSGSLSYLASSKEGHIDLFSLDAGYDFDVTNKFSGSVYADKSFYNSASTAIKSDIKGSIGISLGYDLNFLQLTAGTDILFAQKSDIAVNAGMAHAFHFGEDAALFTITPSVTADMSTLHFYEGYTNRKVGKRTNQANPNAASVSSTTTVNNNRFTLLNYAFSIPINYDTKKIGLFFTPSFALPQNPIYTTTTTIVNFRNGSQSTLVQDSTPQSEKKIENTFYFELGLYIKL